MAGPAETISFIARRLIQFEKAFAQGDIERRRETAMLFNQIARGILSMIEDLSRDRLPHEACRDLILYSTFLQNGIQHELGKVEAEKLSQALEQSCDKEKIFLEFRSSNRKPFLIEELEKAAILVQALANGIHMDPSPLKPS